MPSKEFPEVENPSIATQPICVVCTRPVVIRPSQQLIHLAEKRGKPDPSGLKTRLPHRLPRVRPLTNAWLPFVCPIQVIGEPLHLASAADRSFLFLGSTDSSELRLFDLCEIARQCYWLPPLSIPKHK